MQIQLPLPFTFIRVAVNLTHDQLKKVNLTCGQLATSVKLVICHVDSKPAVHTCILGNCESEIFIQIECQIELVATIQISKLRRYLLYMHSYVKYIATYITATMLTVM